MTSRDPIRMPSRDRLTTLSKASISDMFNVIQDITDPVSKADLIVDWITKTSPTQLAVEQIYMELNPEQLNATFYSFMGTILRSRDYSPPIRSVLKDDGDKSNDRFYDSPMECIPSYKVQNLVRTNRHVFNFTVKCPVEFCPCYGKNGTLVFELEEGRTEKDIGCPSWKSPCYSPHCYLEHAETGLRHTIDHWYCGIIKNGKWFYVSFRGNTCATVKHVLEFGDEVWLGFMIKNRRYKDMTAGWKNYTPDKLVELGKRSDLPYHVWLDIVVAWIQAIHPTEELVATIWSQIQLNRLNYMFIRKACRCLVQAGYETLEGTIKKSYLVTQYQFYGDKRSTWIRLSMRQRKDLLGGRTTKLTVKCPIPGCHATIAESRSGRRKPCTILMEVLEKRIPCYPKNLTLTHGSGYKHVVEHVFVAISPVVSGGKWEVVSLYAYTGTEVKALLRAARKFRMGFLI